MRSVDNVLRVLLIVGAENSVRVTEVAEQLGVAKSTAHRLLDALARRNFVVKDAAHRYWRGPAFTEAGLLADQQLPSWRNIAHVRMRELASRSGETCHLAVLEGNSVRFIDGIASTRELCVGSRVGILLPAHATAPGKAILSAMSAEGVRALYPFGLPGSTPSSPTEPAKMLVLRRELVLSRRRGYAINIGETEVGVTAVGAPLHDASGRVFAALALAAPTVRVPQQEVENLVQELLAAVKDIESDLSSAATASE